VNGALDANKQSFQNYSNLENIFYGVEEKNRKIYETNCQKMKFS
jgi:hypothetical protein